MPIESPSGSPPEDPDLCLPRTPDPAGFPVRPVIDAASIEVGPACLPAGVSGKALEPMTDDAAFWSNFGIEVCHATSSDASGGDLTGILPEGMLIIAAIDPEYNDAAGAIAATISVRPFPFTVGGCRHFAYRSESSSKPAPRLKMPVGVRMLSQGHVQPLPTVTSLGNVAQHVQRLSDLLPIAESDLAPWLVPEREAEVTNTPLRAYSLRGNADEYEQRVLDARPLLGDLAMMGENTIIYAPPNAGKTLITLSLLDTAVREGVVTPGNVYYVNADDSGSGLAEKMRLTDDMGVHTLCPGEKGFKPADLAETLRATARKDRARGVVVIMDTIKKFSDLMSKKDSADFGEACREFARHGGTVVALAHTNKNRNAKGELVPTGTSDLPQDFDAVYIIDTPEGVGSNDERVVQFQALKVRAGGADRSAYAYAHGAGLTYTERLASVRRVDPELFNDYERDLLDQSEGPIIDAIKACIVQGVVKKMDLAKAAAERSRTSVRASVRVLQTYTGDDPTCHHWTYAVRERGAKVFSLLPSGEPEPTSG